MIILSRLRNQRQKQDKQKYGLLTDHVQATIYRRLLIGRDDHLDQSEAYDIS